MVLIVTSEGHRGQRLNKRSVSYRSRVDGPNSAGGRDAPKDSPLNSLRAERVKTLTGSRSDSHLLLRSKGSLLSNLEFVMES